jgi:FimV-like protein
MGIKRPQISTHSSRNISKMTNFSKYAVAAIVLLSFLPLGYQFLSQKMSAEEIFAANFTTEKILDFKNQRSSENNKTKTPEEIEISSSMAIRSKAIISYNEKRYPEAINLFKSYLASGTKIKNKAKVELYLAKAYLADNKLVDAKKILESIIKESKKSTKQDAEWYLVLTLIKEDNVEQAKVGLNKILLSKTASAHKEKALKLQQQIDKNYVQ